MGKNPQENDLSNYFGGLGQKIYNMVQAKDVEDIVAYFALNKRASEFNKIQFVQGLRPWIEGKLPRAGGNRGGLQITADQKYGPLLTNYLRELSMILQCGRQRGQSANQIFAMHYQPTVSKNDWSRTMRDLNVDHNVPVERIYDEILNLHRRQNSNDNEVTKDDINSIFMIAEERNRSGGAPSGGAQMQIFHRDGRPVMPNEMQFDSNGKLSRPYPVCMKDRFNTLVDLDYNSPNYPTQAMFGGMNNTMGYNQPPPNFGNTQNFGSTQFERQLGAT